MYNHPNLWSWRELARQWSGVPSARTFAVFVADLGDPISSPYDAALRRQIESGQRTAEVFIDGRTPSTAVDNPVPSTD